MPVCPRCGVLNGDAARTCRGCSADLTAKAAAAPSAPMVEAPSGTAGATAGRGGRFWLCTLLFAAGIVSGVLLWKSSNINYDSSGPGALDDQYTEVTQNSSVSYEVTYTFTAGGRQFSGKDTLYFVPTTADTTVYYMTADPAKNALHQGTSDTERTVAAGVAFLVALVALILLPKDYPMKVLVPSPAAGVGDSQREPRRTQRGKYGAWAHVWIAFLLQLGGVGLLVAYVVATITKSPMSSYEALGWAGGVAAFSTLWVYSDRFRCIETFSSRACSGVMNLSVLYVPIVALVYANYRGLRKFAGR